jgi:hypothetical protein
VWTSGVTRRLLFSYVDVSFLRPPMSGKRHQG